MRVVAGIKRGFKLAAVTKGTIRPTSERTKQVIFNVLKDALPNSVVLDIFAGSGSLGIEALSRGAAKAIFIESEMAAIKLLIDNLKKTGFFEQAEIFKTTAEKAVKKLSELNIQFDLIFADPPYEGTLAHDTVGRIQDAKLLKSGGWLAIEHSSRTQLTPAAGNLVLKKQKQHGDSTVSFYQYVEA
jgi:16S rRNA (guanine(966)-N(2))-methyltransferase RsmD